MVYVHVRIWYLLLHFVQQVDQNPGLHICNTPRSNNYGYNSSLEVATWDMFAVHVSGIRRFSD